MDKYTNTEKWEKWIADGGITAGRDTDLRLTIPIDIGCGVQMIREDNTWTSTREYGGRNTKYLKTVTLNITSWKGISPDAIHFYGTLEIPNTEFESDNSKRRYSSCGYGVPEYIQHVKIELTRPVTQAMIDNNPEMWEWSYAEDRTTRFDSMEDVVARGVEIFNQWFEKGWALVQEAAWMKKNIILVK